MSRRSVTTLDEFIIQRQKDFPFANGELSSLLRDLGLAAKIIHRDVNKAGLVDILGMSGETNVQGEQVMKLDDFANDTIIQSLKSSGECCGVASEEEDTFVCFHCDGDNTTGKYVVLFDPLDGSSNIDVNVSIGTIFSIFRRKSPVGGPCMDEDFLQKGSEQVAAGYVVYGSSTMMVYTTGNGVNGFTLDPSIGEFCLSHPNIMTPIKAGTYSINQGYFLKFSQGVQRYIKYCQDDVDKKSKSYKLRYIGSMVADFHRNLIKGGIFIYPETKDAPSGKLRLMYECNPLGLLAVQAGGAASNGKMDILDIEPTDLHQRTSVILGSKGMVDEAIRIIGE